MTLENVEPEDFSILIRAMYDDTAFVKSALGGPEARLPHGRSSTPTLFRFAPRKETALSAEVATVVQEVGDGSPMERYSSLYSLSLRLGCQKLQTEMAWYIQEAVATKLLH